MLSFRLFLEGDTLGALNLYSRKVAAFDEQACAVGTVLAAHAAVAMQGAREHDRAEQLEHALASSREIGMAIGVIMARGRMTQEAAFEVLRRASQHLNRKLYDVAAELVETGQLPERPASPPSRGEMTSCRPARLNRRAHRLTPSRGSGGRCSVGRVRGR